MIGTPKTNKLASPFSPNHFIRDNRNSSIFNSGSPFPNWNLKRAAFRRGGDVTYSNSNTPLKRAPYPFQVDDDGSIAEEGQYRPPTGLNSPFLRSEDHFYEEKLRPPFFSPVTHDHPSSILK